MMVNSTLKKFRCQKGSSIISFLVVFVFLIGIIFLDLEISEKQARISDTQQIANLMATHIEQTGRVDTSTDAYLDGLKDIYNMDVSMDVEGNIRNGKLPLESSFIVRITYNDTFNVGISNTSKEKEYVKKAVGITEKYHK